MATRRPQVIAIVDDEASVRKAIVRLFRAAGYEARAFASGREFLETLPFFHYDCLVLDLRMPGMSGFDVQMNNDFATTKIPTIIVTAHDDLESRSRSLVAGAMFYLIKPFDDSVLLKAVQDALNTV